MTHICIAALPLKTFEHQRVHAQNLESAGVEACILDFSSGDSESFFSEMGAQDLVRNRIREQSDLSEHLRETGSTGILFQSPYLEHYPSFLWSAGDSSNAFLLYFGYGLSISDWLEGHVNLGSFPFFDKIASSNRIEFRQLRRAQGVKAILAGDAIMHALSKQAETLKRPKNRLAKVLWAPHWSQSWFSSARGYSRFAEALPAMREFVSSHPEIQVIFRPHPMLETALRGLDQADESVRREVESTLNQLGLHEWRDEFRILSNHPNFRWSSDTLVQDVLGADFLVTEGVSIIGYWSVTGKPMVVWRDRESPGFNKLGRKILRFATPVASAEQLSEAMASVVAKPYGRTRMKIRAFLARRQFVFVKPNPTVYVLRNLGILGTNKRRAADKE